MSEKAYRKYIINSVASSLQSVYLVSYHNIVIKIMCSVLTLNLVDICNVMMTISSKCLCYESEERITNRLLAQRWHNTKLFRNYIIRFLDQYKPIFQYLPICEHWAVHDEQDSIIIIQRNCTKDAKTCLASQQSAIRARVRIIGQYRFKNIESGDHTFNFQQLYVEILICFCFDAFLLV